MSLVKKLYVNVQTNAECWANGLGMNQNVSRIIAEVKLSLIFNVSLKSTFSPLNLNLLVDNRPSILAITERKQKPRNGSCSNQKHNCTTLQPLKEGEQKLVVEEDKLLEDDICTKVVLLGVSGVVSPGASALVPSELLSGH